MNKELLVFVPGLSARAPAKYTARLVVNLRNYALTCGEAFSAGPEGAGGAAPEGAAGGAITFEHQSNGVQATQKQIVFREVVWADIPVRLSELSGKDKFLKGLSLLVWASGSLILTPTVLWKNAYQSICMLGGLLVLVLWYLGIIVAVPTLVNESLPLGLDKSLQDSLGAVSHAIKGLSFGGVQIWVLTSFIMGLLPVTAVVDAAYAIKQYIRDGQIAGRTGLVGEEARVRIANALNEIHKEQGSTNGPTYTRITFLSYSFGTIPTIEALSTYRADLRAPVRLITLGAPITFVGALRPAITETARSFIETGKAPGGSSLASWLCFWSPLDYMSSDPADISNTKWSGFSSNPLKGSRSLWLSHNHDLYFDDDDVAKAILEHSCNAPALPASAQ